MKTVFLTAFALMSLVLTSQITKAASMISPKVELSFFSKDGLPIAKVPLAGILSFEHLTTKDCSGFICLPSLPRYKRGGEAGQILGTTDENGVLVVNPRKWSTSKLSAKNLSVMFFTNGTIPDLCNDGTASYYQDFLDLLPQWNNKQPVERNAECLNAEAVDGDRNTAVIKCYSPFTHQEIEEKREAILKGCK